MGKTSKPLTIMADEELIDTPQVQDLVASGHRVWGKPEPGIDLVLSKKAWRMTPALLKYLPLAVKAARQQKYSNKKGGPDAD